MWLKPEEVLLKNSLKLWVDQKSSGCFIPQHTAGSARGSVTSPKLERTFNVFLADTIWITTQNKERDFFMFLILDEAFKIMEQLVNVMLRRLLDNEVGGMEKMEDTSLLPSPIIISIRSKMAFQFIELKDRETLVEGLLERLKQRILKALREKNQITFRGKPTGISADFSIQTLKAQGQAQTLRRKELTGLSQAQAPQDKDPPRSPGACRAAVCTGQRSHSQRVSAETAATDAANHPELAHTIG
ncbi:TBC1 domain family member 8 [Sciurus carolinensis]|uniref:TBC1 domain family member 8 n=1 Tax=Sciurus carolinensis TaxID=30640 RepID=A0AA41NJQ7_SCICA|nr:TBC1 domain family member 8 [Sciurus carolinensis]